MTLERLLEIEQGWWLTETRTRSFSPRGLERRSEATRAPSRAAEEWLWVRLRASAAEQGALRELYEDGRELAALALWRERALELEGPAYGDAPPCGEELAQLAAASAMAGQPEDPRDRSEARGIARENRRRMEALRARVGRRTREEQVESPASVQDSSAENLKK